MLYPPLTDEYENAICSINHVLGMYMAAIYREEASTTRNENKIKTLKEQFTKINRERDRLSCDDAEAIYRVLRDYPAIFERNREVDGVFV